MNAQIWMGSDEVQGKTYSQRLSPYDGRLVSMAAVCNANDARQALNVAQNASKIAKKVPLHQRCSWLMDVASKLREQREEFARVLCDEVGKPIAYARIEVDRCIETITLSAETMRTLHGETINTDAMPSGRKAHAYWQRVPCGVVVA
ncbi:MAG: aldehyde dehydrogenase family protein, partial [Sulfuricurvum sp.]|nr:aldehyde dehydrogenase family protein [Sulfuricurvum sp.]